MPDTSKYKTAHALAKELLAGPDIIVVLPTPVFDMPGQCVAFPVRIEMIKVETSQAVAILPDSAAIEAATDETDDRNRPPTPQG